ncbi:hypothetical protein D7I45_00150 [Apilactobacillus bombintestini]|uniref:Uncharacterized protein n=1 Tax=Apilactobacillus bombintestini TaxID=2419772 RepID=A0A387AQV2_9LACO|nr:hypothetical protein D7I45_00150 [Apilactobacillus bombintestini]
MLASDLSVQIKLIIMYTIGVIALLALIFSLYRKHYSFKNKNTIMIIIIAVIMLVILGDVIY